MMTGRLRCEFLSLLLFLLISCAYNAVSVRAQIDATVPELPEITTTIVGTGAFFPSFIYNDWFFGWELESPSTAIQYVAKDSGFGIAAILTNQTQFGASDAPLSDEVFQKFKNSTQLFPFVAGAVIPLLNLQIVDEVIFANDTLFFSRETWADIWLGKITRWNDPRIQVENPTLAPFISDIPIQLVLRGDFAGTNYIFSSTLSSISQEWADLYGTFTVPPANLLTAPQISFVRFSEISCTAAVQETVGGLGYVPLGFVVEFLSQVKIAGMYNRQHVRVLPSEKSMIGAQERAVFNEQFYADIVDEPGEFSWPMESFSYLFVRTDINTNCSAVREMYLSFRYILLDPQLRARAIDRGYVALIPSIVTSVLDTLREITCDGQSVLAILDIELHSSVAFPITLALGVTLLILCVAMILAVYFLKERDSEIGFLFALSTVIGLILLLGSLITWFLDPEYTGVCMSRAWMTCMALTTLLGVLFTRISLLQTFYNQMKKDKPLGAGWVLHFAVAMGILLVVQVLILLFFTIFSYIQGTFVFTQPTALIGEYQCQGDHLYLFLIIQAIIYGVMLLWGSVMVYRTWDMSDSLTESRWILITVYNVLIVMIIVIALTATGVINSEDSVAMMALWVLLLLGCFISGCIYLPPLLDMAWQAFRHRHSTYDNERGGPKREESRDF